MPDEVRDVSSLSEKEHARLAHVVMRKQAALSLSVAAIFLAIVLGLPLVNLYLPQVAQQPVLGFPLSWLFLGVLFFPITWVLSAVFIAQSNKIEDACEDWRTTLDREAGWDTAEDDR